MRKYNQLIGATGLGSALGSGIIVGLAVTITLWQKEMGLTDGHRNHFQWKQEHLYRDLLMDFPDFYVAGLR